ncbi:division plane positioning ATPase MipZ [Paraburkholderia sediminicola]|uniref:division plane positioning ATPase MipZ n=1 Tax=Paraburkholderia sediminicola TaxID=458836 RepID=UPI0038B9DD0E
MAIYVFAHTKGGVTKTTTAINMAAMRAADGRRPLLSDSDSGQSSARFINARKLADRTPELVDIPFVSLVSYMQDDHSWYQIDQDILKLAKKFDDVLIDAGGEGHGSPEIRMALTIADMVITPCGTSRPDTDRLAPMDAMIRDARVLNPKLKAVLFPTRASTNARSSDVIDFYRDVARFKQYEVLETVVRTRDCYTKWLTTGEAVFEQKKPPKAALTEMAGLYKEIFNGR